MTTKSVLKMLEENRKTMMALTDNNADNGNRNKMDVDNNGDAKINSSTPVSEIVEGILERETWKGQRASKLSIDDFLQLLAEFNEAGIHFS
jgi:18S rRNA (adenine1779-N6/adenine1780-N6)-dimethyltransferase